MGFLLSLRRVSLYLNRLFSTVFERSREMFYRTLKWILRRICSVLSSLYRCLKRVFHRIQAIPSLPSKDKKNSWPTPPSNPRRKESDHPPVEQALLNSSSDADPQCQNQNINVFHDQCLEQNHEYSSVSTKNQKNESYTDQHDQEPGIFISVGKNKCEETCEEKESEGEKVIESKVVVEKARWIKHYSSRHRILLVGEGKNKCEETCEEKESEGEKVIESTVVVEKARWIKHYSSRHRILLVGEGDFSFSCSLAVAFGCASRMLATSLDSKEFLKKNYAKAPWNICELVKRGCIVMHGIDATAIATHQLLGHMTFDRIIYNFPFAGFFKGLSRDSSLRRHRRLVSLFLKNAKEMIDEDGEIHISHKTNGYHNEWKLVSMASSHGLRLIEEVEFDLGDYPGYNTKRGFGGDENFNCYPSNTFKFGLKFVGHGYGKC